MSAMLWRLHDAMQPWSGHPTGCASCGEVEFSPDVEAFERTGKLICQDCFDLLDDVAAEDMGAS